MGKAFYASNALRVAIVLALTAMLCFCAIPVHAFDATQPVIVKIEESVIPLSSAGNGWAVMDMLCVVMTCIMSAAMMKEVAISRAIAGDTTNEDATFSDREKQSMWCYLSLIPAVFSIVYFFICEDFSHAPRFVDTHTPFMCALTFIQAMFMGFTKNGEWN